MVVDNLALMPDFLDPINLLSYFGTWALIGLLVVVFVESGVLFPILPGDSLLFVAGMLAAGISTASAEGNVADVNFQLWQLLLFIPIAAILGAQVGYWIGRNVGTAMFKPNARFLKQKYLDEAHLFFEQIRKMRRTRDGGLLGVSPLEVTGLWTAPICRTLLQVAPLGAEMHWQTQALMDGILTDVLVRLCRAAAEVYAGHALKGKMKPSHRVFHGLSAELMEKPFAFGWTERRRFAIAPSYKVFLICEVQQFYGSSVLSFHQ